MYFAAERTFLAWIRTGLALMGFGFVVARFAVFLREMAVNSPGHPAHAPGLSLWTGTSLIAIGVAVEVAAALNHIRVIKRMNQGPGCSGPPGVHRGRGRAGAGRGRPGDGHRSLAPAMRFARRRYNYFKRVF